MGTVGGGFLSAQRRHINWSLGIVHCSSSIRLIGPSDVRMAVGIEMGHLLSAGL